MTASEFIWELERVRDQFLWRLEPNLGPGAERRAQPRLWVRACLKEASEDPNTDQIKLDPIGAVCYATLERLFEPGYWPDAAEALGLDLGDGLNVIAAANDRTWKDGSGVRHPDAYLQSLRRRLMEAVGLAGEAASAAGGEELP